MKKSKVRKPAALCAAVLMAAQGIGTAAPAQAQVVEKLAEEPVMEVFPEEKDAEKKEASFGNVRQQVNAPRTYTADFSETLPVEGSDREMILHAVSYTHLDVYKRQVHFYQYLLCL